MKLHNLTDGPEGILPCEKKPVFMSPSYKQARRVNDVIRRQRQSIRYQPEDKHHNRDMKELNA